jgi:hypothetical protein
MEMARLSTGEMLSGKDIDANAHRERTRQKRLRKWLRILGVVFAYLLWRLVNDNRSDSVFRAGSWGTPRSSSPWV